MLKTLLSLRKIYPEKLISSWFSSLKGKNIRANFSTPLGVIFATLKNVKIFHLLF